VRLSEKGTVLAREDAEAFVMALQRITKEELERRIDAGEPITVLDTRAPDSWNTSDVQIPGAFRVPPDEVREHLSEIPRDRLVVTYCT
jgi:rhodanese-related sulfurtransferase